MSKTELKAWLLIHKMDAMGLAKLLGVTYMAVVHWVDGRRSVSLTVSRLLRFFNRHPEMIKEFNK